MSDYNMSETMLDMYLFETTQNIEQLEMCIIDSEKSNCFSKEAINEIFRIMHTIKGSSAMMLYNDIASLAHTMEDLFYYIRENEEQDISSATLSDLVLECVDFIKIELVKIEAQDMVDGDCSDLIDRIKRVVSNLKQHSPNTVIEREANSSKAQQYYISPELQKSSTNRTTYKAIIYFADGCEMENIRAYSIIHNIKQMTNEVYYSPEDIISNDETTKFIRNNGFLIYLKSDKTYEEMHEFFMQTIFLRKLELTQLDDEIEFKRFEEESKTKDSNQEVKIPQVNVENITSPVKTSTTANQNIISVSVNKLDKLMDLVGEMVISEAMVTQNPDLNGLEIENFRKAARQLRKITSELQDMVMSIRMVPLATTFHKMHRIVRDMSKKLNKDIKLELIGEETEVDKNIIEQISDPLMHLVRNAIDHGIETVTHREETGKSKTGTITLEAKNVGGDVLVLVKDDGRGLNKEKILKRAREHDLLTKPEEEMTEKEIYQLIFLPGFSTKESVTEFSGRGVGMDVVTRNVEEVGGTIQVSSNEGEGTIVTIKIPLTLAIIGGMNIRVGKSRFTLPTTAIIQSFRPNSSDIITDPDGNEIVMVRGLCYPVIRLHQQFAVKTEIKDFSEGILIMVEQEEKRACVFADELLGQQQVVVKSLPKYIKDTRKIEGLSGCTLLGDGSISLILDIGNLLTRY